MRGGFLLLTAVALAAALALVSARRRASSAGRRASRGAHRPRARGCCSRPRSRPRRSRRPRVPRRRLGHRLFASPLHCAERFAAASPALSRPRVPLALGSRGSRLSGRSRRSPALRAASRGGASRARRGRWAGLPARPLRRRPRLRARLPAPRGLRERRARRADGCALPRDRARPRARPRARRDPLRRLVAAPRPRAASPRRRAPARPRAAPAEEASADAEAARALGDRGRVAEALVRFARSGAPAPPRGRLPGDALEARVREMLAPSGARGAVAPGPCSAALRAVALAPPSSLSLLTARPCSLRAGGSLRSARLLRALADHKLRSTIGVARWRTPMTTARLVVSLIAFVGSCSVSPPPQRRGRASSAR